MNVGEFSTWVVFLAKPNYDQESILGNWYSGLTMIRPGLILILINEDFSMTLALMPILNRPPCSLFNELTVGWLNIRITYVGCLWVWW